MTFTNLPTEWKWAKLTDLVISPKDDIVDGPFGSNLKASEYVNEGVPIIRLQNISRNKFIPKNIRYISEKKADELKRHSYQIGDIVITKLGNPLGEACIVPDTFSDGVIVADVVRVRITTNKVSKQYLCYAVNSDQIIKQLKNKTKGTTRPRVNLTHIRDLMIPLAPLPEQERIIARIESLFTQLDAGVAGLKHAQAALKRYRASVLKAAVEGRLVPQDPNDEPAEGSLKNAILENGDRDNVIDEDLYELPKGWVWAKAKNISEFITKGTTPKASKLFSKEEIPFIKVYNLTFNGELNFNISPTFIKRETHIGELSRSKVYPGDVLMNIVGPPLGKVSIVPETHLEWNINQAIARFRPIEACNNRYLSLALRSGNVLNWAISRAKATAGQFNLTLEICRNLPIPIPPLNEQNKIVSEVERRLSLADGMEHTITIALARSQKMKQAILKNAFTGKLCS